METATIRKLNDSTLVLTVGNMIAIIDTVAPGVIVLRQPTDAILAFWAGEPTEGSERRSA